MQKHLVMTLLEFDTMGQLIEIIVQLWQHIIIILLLLLNDRVLQLCDIELKLMEIIVLPWDIIVQQMVSIVPLCDQIMLQMDNHLRLWDQITLRQDGDLQLCDYIILSHQVHLLQLEQVIVLMVEMEQVQVLDKI